MVARGDGVIADGALAFARLGFRLAGQADRLLRLELAQQPQRGRIAGQRETPDAQARGVVVQLQHGGAGVVGKIQGQLGAVRPGFPAGIGRIAGDHAAVGDRDQAGLELQPLIQVNFNPGQQGFILRQFGADFIPPAGRKGFG